MGIVVGCGLGMLIVLLRGKRDLVVMETVCKLCCLRVSLNLFEVEVGDFLFWALY
jgi:hypothetical protein